MIEVNAYQESYFEIVEMLHVTNDSPLADILVPEMLPEVGFLAMEGAIPVAAGFLRRLEGEYAQIDTLVSNKDLSSQMRHEGLDELVKALIVKARSLGIKGLICFSKDEGVLSRANSMGFHETGDKVIALPLN